MFPKSLEEQILELESIGETQVRYLRSQYKNPSPDSDPRVVDEWLRQKEAERTAASASERAMRENSTLSIARRANIIAITAAIITAAFTIISIILK